MQLSDISGIGPKRIALLQELGIYTADDLLRYYPKEYLDFSDVTAVKDAEEGETVTLKDVLYDAGAVKVAVQDKNGSPLLNVPCRIAPDDPSSIEKPRDGVTMGGGLFVVRGLFPGKYTVTANPPGGKPLTGSVLIVAHQAIDTVLRAE